MNLELPCFPNDLAAFSTSIYDLFHKDCESSIVNFDEIEKVYNGLKEI